MVSVYYICTYMYALCRSGSGGERPFISDSYICIYISIHPAEVAAAGRGLPSAHLEARKACEHSGSIYT